MNTFVIVKNEAYGNAEVTVVTKDLSMYSPRRTRIYLQRHSATDWLVMRVCVTHLVSRTGVGYGDMSSRHLKWMSPSPTIFFVGKLCLSPNYFIMNVTVAYDCE